MKVKKKLKKYGITIDQYDAMLKFQNNCCNICKTHKSEFKKNLAVDHCHKTGKVRKLLCHKCNTTLGLMDENIDNLNKLIEYIKEYN